jgi:hypothetical protein
MGKLLLKFAAVSAEIILPSTVILVTEVIYALPAVLSKWYSTFTSNVLPGMERALLGSGSIVGIVMGGFVLLVAIAVAVSRWFRRRARTTNIQLEPTNAVPSTKFTPSPMPSSNQPLRTGAAATPQGVNTLIGQ